MTLRASVTNLAIILSYAAAVCISSKLAVGQFPFRELHCLCLIFSAAHWCHEHCNVGAEQKADLLTCAFLMRGIDPANQVSKGRQCHGMMCIRGCHKYNFTGRLPELHVCWSRSPKGQISYSDRFIPTRSATARLNFSIYDRDTAAAEAPSNAYVLTCPCPCPALPCPGLDLPTPAPAPALPWRCLCPVLSCSALGVSCVRAPCQHCHAMPIVYSYFACHAAQACSFSMPVVCQTPSSTH